MDQTTIDGLVKTCCTIYKNRGFITVDNIQDLLDENDATLLETNRIMSLLDELGCKITEGDSLEDDLSFYDGSKQDQGLTVLDRFSAFLKKEKIDAISSLEYALKDYEIGVLYYIYLRLTLKLTKAATIKNLKSLQNGYSSALNYGEDKVVFDIQSAEYMQKICDDLQHVSLPVKVKREYKSAIVNYQYFLTLNMHTVIANCEARMKS